MMKMEIILVALVVIRRLEAITGTTTGVLELIEATRVDAIVSCKLSALLSTGERQGCLVGHETCLDPVTTQVGLCFCVYETYQCPSQHHHRQRHQESIRTSW